MTKDQLGKRDCACVSPNHCCESDEQFWRRIGKPNPEPRVAGPGAAGPNWLGSVPRSPPGRGKITVTEPQGARAHHTQEGQQ